MTKSGCGSRPTTCTRPTSSGGEPYTITIPNACADAEFEYEWHHTTFVNYLRKAFPSGAGFPGWQRDKKPPRAAIAKLTRRAAPPLIMANWRQRPTSSFLKRNHP